MASTSRFVATISTPGYLPEKEPVVFNTAREAWQYLEDEFNLALDEADPTDRLDRVNREFVTRWNHENAGIVYAPTPGYDGDHDLGIAYSVQEVDLVELLSWTPPRTRVSFYVELPDEQELRVHDDGWKVWVHMPGGNVHTWSDVNSTRLPDFESAKPIVAEILLKEGLV